MGAGHLEIKVPDEQLFPVKPLFQQHLEVSWFGLVVVGQLDELFGCGFQAFLDKGQVADVLVKYLGQHSKLGRVSPVIISG